MPFCGTSRQDPFNWAWQNLYQFGASSPISLYVWSISRCSDAGPTPVSLLWKSLAKWLVISMVCIVLYHIISVPGNSLWPVRVGSMTPLNVQWPTYHEIQLTQQSLPRRGCIATKQLWHCLVSHASKPARAAVYTTPATKASIGRPRLRGRWPSTRAPVHQRHHPAVRCDRGCQQGVPATTTRQ